MTDRVRAPVRGHLPTVTVWHNPRCSKSRTAVELLVLCVGIALGGSIGIGTAVFAFGIGPLVQVFLPRLTMKPI